MTPRTLLRHVEACNHFDPDDFKAFAIAGQPVGCIRGDSAEFLISHRLAAGTSDGVGIAGGGFKAVSAKLAEIVDALAGAGLMGEPRGEMTPVMRRWGAAPLAEIDRAGLPGLGLPAFGVHVNGFVRANGGICLWVGCRAKDRQVAPGKLDHLVAGGLPMGYTAGETVIKEAQEEAGLPADIASRAVPAGSVSYRLTLPEGLRCDTLFVYDLELEKGVVPANCDGEVERFELWPIPRVIETLRDTDDFKFNVPLVLIDFLIRHGLIEPDTEPDYTALVKGLRR